jgi:hypothetical protein
MKRRFLFGIGGIVVTLIVAVLFLQESLTQDKPPETNQNFDASHFSDMRIENEDKLDVPREKVDEVGRIWLIV